MSRMLVALALAAAAVSFSHPARTQQSRALPFPTELPLLDCDGAPCVEAKIGDGQNVKLAIDTGNVDSVLDAKVASAAGIKPSGSLEANAAAGMLRTAIPSIKLGTVTLTDAPALSMDLGEMIEHRQMPHVGGTLAYTAFKDRAIELDFAAKKVRISDVLTSTVPCSGSCDKLSLISFGKEGPPVVVAGGFAINGKKLLAQVDTMFTGSLLVYTDSVAKLGLSSEAATKQTELFPLTDGGVEMKVAAAKTVSFHELALDGATPKVYFPTPDVHEPDGLFDATAGLELFRNAVVTLDFHNMTIAVRKQ